MAVDVVALDHHVGDLAAIDLGKEFGEREGSLRTAAGRALEQVEESNQQQTYDDPEGEILAEVVHASEPFLAEAERIIPRTLHPDERRRKAETRSLRHTDKMRRSLNNCKARPRQHANRPKIDRQPCNFARGNVVSHETQVGHEPNTVKIIERG
jgi:hypothetical protein